MLPQIIPYFPNDINVFVDLFCGGGDVGVNIDANTVICNDILSEVIELMQEFQKYSPCEIMGFIDDTIAKYELSNTFVKSYSDYGCNSNDGLSKYNKERFQKLREDYNKGKRTPIMFYTMVMYAFNNYIKLNDEGEFLNSSANKRDFNSALRKRIELFIEKIHQKSITFTNYDFRSFDIGDLCENDFVYIDPPYLITNVSYTSDWGEKDERDLLTFIDSLHTKGIRFALSNVLQHKGRTNTILTEWSEKYIVYDLDFDYGNCNYKSKNKSSSNSREVLITNYQK